MASLNWLILAEQQDRKSRRKLALQAMWDGNAKALWDPVTEVKWLSTRKYRDKIMEWAVSHEPNLWVTVSYRKSKYGVEDFIYVHQKMDRLLNRICQKAYGKGYFRNGGAPPPVFGFLEHPSTNKHYNLLINADEAFENAMRNHGERTWRKLIRSAGFHMKSITSRNDLIKYCLKEQLTLAHYSSAYYFRGLRQV